MDSRLTSLIHHGRDLTRAERRVLVFIADLHFRLYDDAIHFAAEAGEVSSFESNLVMLIDLLLLRATTDNPA